MVCNFFSSVIGNIANCNAFFACCFNVNIIITHTTANNALALIKLGDDASRDFDVMKNQNAFYFRGKGIDIRINVSIQDFDISTAFENRVFDVCFFEVIGDKYQRFFNCH